MEVDRCSWADPEGVGAGRSLPPPEKSEMTIGFLSHTGMDIPPIEQQLDPRGMFVWPSMENVDH